MFLQITEEQELPLFPFDPLQNFVSNQKHLWVWSKDAICGL